MMHAYEDLVLRSKPSERIGVLVSGRSCVRRETALLAMTSQAFIDESGGEDTGSCVVGGYLASVDTWKAFSADWQAVLDKEPKWPAFHAAPCNFGREAPWCGFEEPARISRQLELAAIIKKHEPHAFLTAINVPRFKGERGEIARSVSDGRPYIMAATALVPSLLRFHEAKGRDFGTVDFIFDFHQQFRKAVRDEIEDHLVPSLPIHSPRMAHRLGSIHWPRPEERDNYVPLQAADMLVWHWRRCRDTQYGRYRGVYRALIEASDPLILKYPEDSGFEHIFSAHILGPQKD